MTVASSPLAWPSNRVFSLAVLAILSSFRKRRQEEKDETKRNETRQESMATLAYSGPEAIDPRGEKS